MCDKQEEYKVDRHVQILTVFCCMSMHYKGFMCFAVCASIKKRSRPSFVSECLRVNCVFVHVCVLCFVARLRRRQRNKLVACCDKMLDSIYLVGYSLRFLLVAGLVAFEQQETF